ncbi:MAG: protein kinase [Pirellulaceae bacterium]|nr:protein kinase [Pirellulaceae bacterium]
MIDRDERAKLWNLVEDTISRWREGEQPDAASFLAAHPEIGSRRTLALDLIHEEWCLRHEAGETVVATSFIERFSQFRSSVAKMVAVEMGVEADPHFAQTLSESLWPQVGQEFHGFSIVEPLGRGALARVYLAREISMGNRPVVIKVAQHGGHEAHLLGKLEHPNIVAAYSVKHDPESGMTVICMPLLGTSTALDLLDSTYRSAAAPKSAGIIAQVSRRYVPAGFVREESLRAAWPFESRSFVEGIIWLGQELAAGLVAAGNLEIAHRDIKPSNILLAWSGRPMLLDFNLSSGEGQRADRVGGTLAYMAPERIAMLLRAENPKSEQIDPRPDIFSLGVVLYELLTGKLPVQPADAEASDEASLCQWLASRSQPVAPPSRINCAVDAAVDQIVLRCLASDPTDRYVTADELLVDLSDYLSPWQTTVRWGRRNRRGLLAAGLLGAAALVGGSAFWATRPPLAELYYQDGLAFYQAGKYPSAVASFTASLDEEPGSAKVLFARGQSHFQMQEFALAEQDYLAAVQREPKATLWFAAGVCALQRNDAKLAAQYFTNAKNAGYDDTSFKCNTAICFARGGNVRGALTTLRRLSDGENPFRPALIELSRLLLAQGTGGDHRAVDEGLDAITRAELIRPLSRAELYQATLLAALKFESDHSTRKQAADYFERLRALDGPDKIYDRNPILQKLLAAEPALREIPPKLMAPTPPDPPRGALPPDTAILDEVL